MRVVDVLSKLQLAVTRRLPIDIDTLYVPALGQRVRLPKQISSVFNEVFLHRIYQPPRPLPPTPTIVDLGANLGLFMIYMNQTTRGATIHGVEANPNAIPYLRDNIALMADYANLIQLHHLAVAGHNGTVRFQSDQTIKANVACTAVLDISSFGDYANFHTVEVPCRRLDEIVGGRIDYLKCDIEGSEYEVLDEGILHPDKTAQAVCEFHDVHHRRSLLQQVIERALRAGYDVSHPDGRGFADWPALESWLNRPTEPGIVLKFCAQA